MMGRYYNFTFLIFNPVLAVSVIAVAWLHCVVAAAVFAEETLEGILK